jgi:hypothetical protein
MGGLESKKSAELLSFAIGVIKTAALKDNG